MILNCTITFEDGTVVDAVYCNDRDYSFFMDKATGNILHNLTNANINFKGVYKDE